MVVVFLGSVLAKKGYFNMDKQRVSHSFASHPIDLHDVFLVAIQGEFGLFYTLSLVLQYCFNYIL
jgi:hypothetical protein